MSIDGSSPEPHISAELEKLLVSYLEDGASPEEAVEVLMRRLDREKVLYYSDPGRAQILNNAGRCFLAVLEDPGITQRALAMYLRISESNVHKSLKTLANDGLITHTKTGNRKHYSFNPEIGFTHPDVTRLLHCIVPLYLEWQAKQQKPHRKEG